MHRPTPRKRRAVLRCIMGKLLRLGAHQKPSLSQLSGEFHPQLRSGRPLLGNCVVSYTIMLTDVNENIGRSWRRRDAV